MDKKIVFGLTLFFLICISQMALAQVVQTTIFYDDFADGSITDWSQTTGTWSGATNQLVGGALDGATIVHDATINISSPNIVKVVLEYKNNTNVVGLNNSFMWMFDQNTPNNDTKGYRVLLQSGTSVLQKLAGGIATNLDTNTGFAPGTLRQVRINHDSNGLISVYVAGNLELQALDLTYTSGSKIGVSTTNGAGDGIWDDFNVVSIQNDTSRFFIVNEETYTGLTNATLKINGIDWPVHQTDGNFDVNSGIIFPATFEISRSGYDTRTLNFDTNAGLQMVKKLGLRDFNEANDIEFQFYSTDETTILSNRWISVLKGSGTDQTVVGRGETDSSGKITFNLAPQESGYDFNIFVAGTDYGDTNIFATYDAVSTTINRPKDEDSLADIAGGFDLAVGGLGVQSYSNQSSFPFTTITILGNTINAYTLRVVDENTTGEQYFAREYVMQTKGDVSSLTINPYLVKITDGELVTFIVWNILTNTTISNKLLTLTRPINGVITTVEERVSNAAGAATFSFLDQLSYDVTVTDLNETTTYFPDSGESATFDNVYTAYYIFINDTNQGSVFNPQDFNIVYSPNTDTLSKTSQRVDVNVSTTFAETITIKYYDQNTLVQLVSANNTDLNDFQILNLSTFGDFLTIEVVITKGIILTKQSRTFYLTNEEPTIIESFRAFRNNAGQVAAAVVTVIFILMAISAFGPSPFGGDSQIFLVGLILIVAGYLFFLPDLSMIILFSLIAGLLFWAKDKV